MRTVRVTLDEELADDVDRAVEALGTSRSAFTRQALRSALEAMHIEELERRHREGYDRHPVAPGEVDAWEDEQVWAD